MSGKPVGTTSLKWSPGNRWELQKYRQSGTAWGRLTGLPFVVTAGRISLAYPASNYPHSCQSKSALLLCGKMEGKDSRREPFQKPEESVRLKVSLSTPDWSIDWVQNVQNAWTLLSLGGSGSPSILDQLGLLKMPPPQDRPSIWWNFFSGRRSTFQLRWQIIQDKK